MDTVLNSIKNIVPTEKHTTTSFASWCCGKAYVVVLVFLAFVVTVKQGSNKIMPGVAEFDVYLSTLCQDRKENDNASNSKIVARFLVMLR